jgi:hypothetical protein
MAVARIDNDRDLVDACTDKLVVRQKTASYSNIYMLNADIKSNKACKEVLRQGSPSFISKWSIMTELSH